ncbi:MAG: MFS transporter [Deltaproteobacteria bacterium]|nr:MFS transporter [Deltaproteobacteria bacterium]
MNSRLKSADGFYGWMNLVVMFFFNLALMPMLMSFMLFLPYWVEEFGWSRGLASGAQALSVILMGLAAPMVAVFIMKQGPKRAIVGGNVLCVAGLVLLSYQNHLWQLYLGVGVLLGLGVSIGGMLAMMTVINNWFIMKRTIALAISMASMGFSGVVINPSVMALIETIGWRSTYLILAAAALIFCVVLPGLFIINKPEDLGQVPDGPASAKHETAKTDEQKYKHLDKTPVDFTAKEALRTRALWLLVGYGALSMLVAMGAGTHIIAFQFDIGIPAITAAFVGSVFSAVMGIGQLGVGFLGLRVKMHYLAVCSMILAVVGFSMLLFAKSLPLMIAYAIIFGMGSGIQFIAIGNLFPDYFGRSEFPKIMGYTMPFNTIISSIGAPIVGYIREWTGSYIPAFKIFLALLVVSFFCILFAKPPVHPSLKTSHA